MNRIAGRAWALWLAIAILLGGVGYFLYEYFHEAGSWVMHNGNPHIYEGGKPVTACGTVVDRDGTLLLNLTNGRNYAADPDIRSATMHWLGDRTGNISAPALAYYVKEMAGFDVVGGIYSYGGTGGQAALTLSARVQKAALEALGDYKGTLAVYNYKTGQILCAVTTPTYDPEQAPDIAGDTTGAFEGVYLNRFVQSAYTPGSIMKIVTTAAALEEIEDIQQRTFTCTGTYDFGVDKVTCERVHGRLDIKSAMMRSCNCAYAQIALLLGREKLQQYVDTFAVTKSLTFDGITTASGNFRVTDAADVELAWSAIGQHKDLINPCAYLAFVGAVANGGQGVTPYIMESITVGDKLTYQAQTKQMERVMSEETAQILREFMRNNVVNNYGAENFPGLTVCAKSGTGELDGAQRSNAMFTGFVADEMYPLAFIAAVEDAGYGKIVCMPMIAKVLAVCKDVMDHA